MGRRSTHARMAMFFTARRSQANDNDVEAQASHERHRLKLKLEFSNKRQHMSSRGLAYLGSSAGTKHHVSQHEVAMRLADHRKMRPIEWMQ